MRSRFISTSLAAACSLTLFGACGQMVDEATTDDSTRSAQTVCAGTTVEGIDVSEWQGTINWASVRASGRRFAYIRVADGAYQDKTFATNWASAKANGLLRGPYFFFRPGQDPTTQANLLISKVGKLAAGDLPCALDIEVTDGVSAATIVSRMRTFLAAVEAGTGRRPIIYSSTGFWPTLGNPDLSAYPLWDAAWYVSCPGVPAYYSTWKFWQYTDKGSVSGISGVVDLDQFNGSLSDLTAYANGGGGGGGSLGGGVVGNFSVTPNADGRLEAFVRGTDGQMWTTFQTAPGAGWTTWYSLAGSGGGAPIMGVWNDGRLEAFARGADNALWHAWQGSPNGSFSGWDSLGGAISGDPAVGVNADGRLEIVVRGTDGNIYHNWWLSGGGWSGFAGLGTAPSGGLSDPAVVRGAGGRLFVFARDSSGSIRVISQTSPGGAWNTWTNLYGVTQEAPAVGVNQDGRIEIFSRGSDGALWHNWETSPGGSFSGFSTLNGTDIHDPTVVSDADGRLEVFVRGGDNNLYRIAQVAPNSGWNPYASAGITVTTRPAASRNQDGRLEVFTRATDGTLNHAWQSSPGNW